MEKVRLGIIGVGNMGTGHLKSIVDGDCPRIKVTAFSDIDSRKLARAKSLCPEATAFEDPVKMLDSGLFDAVLIATPHYLHPVFAKECFKRKLHVLTEKPAGVYTRQVREMNDAAKEAGVIFAIMFNQRTNPLFKKAKEIVQSGQLGEAKRLVWIVTNWYRAQSYYDSSSWRATWDGEGGGVLLNQAPHNLDLWQWIFGMPKSVRAYCGFGKYHHIPVEDDATIFAEYENGATAAFITSTGEVPGTNRLEISGDKGKLVLESGTLKWTKLLIPERELCFSSKIGSPVPETEYEEFSAPEPDGHPIILNNFADAILDGAPLIAPGEEGLNSLSISNAAYISAWTGDSVEIPVSEAIFEEYLRSLREEERSQTKSSNQDQKAEPELEPIEKLRERWKVKW